MNNATPDAPLPADFEWNDIYSGTPDDYEPPDALLLELAADLSPGDVLDVGCGAGGLLAALAERGWKAHGIDVAERGIRAARGVLAQRGIEADLEVADATTWRPTRTFDLVTNSFALPMTKNEQSAAYRTIRDAVAPGGTVLIKDFDPQMARLAPFAGIHLVSVEELTAAFEGFEILRAEVVETPAHHHADTSSQGAWTAALLVARRPRV